MSKYGAQLDSVAAATWTLFVVTIAQKPPFRIMKVFVVLLKWLIWQQPGQKPAADIAVSSRVEAVFGDHITFVAN